MRRTLERGPRSAEKIGGPRSQKRVHIVFAAGKLASSSRAVFDGPLDPAQVWGTVLPQPPRR